jgi:hypothetical protein
MTHLLAANSDTNNMNKAAQAGNAQGPRRPEAGEREVLVSLPVTAHSTRGESPVLRNALRTMGSTAPQLLSRAELHRRHGKSDEYRW